MLSLSQQAWEVPTLLFVHFHLSLVKIEVREITNCLGYFPNEIQLINSIQLQDYSFTV